MTDNDDLEHVSEKIFLNGQLYGRYTFARHLLEFGKNDPNRLQIILARLRQEVEDYSD